MTRYDPSSIEPKWRKVWEESGAHRTLDDSPKPSYYCLDMFPYPSGSGLHVGHWRGYVLSDVWARYKTLQGYNVLHPMGWDSFGLPAENDAILKGIHPKGNTARNIANMKRQLQEIGAMYDWAREINSSSPEYYKWTQWIFLKMFERGLAYRKMMPINWCPSCRTGLANEEVVGGVCERCGTEVTKKDLMQWMLRITAYAGRLLDDLDKLDWPDKVKAMQANWIGRSEGADVLFKAIAPDGDETFDLPVFTTRPDTLFGATYVVLAPEHPLVEQLTVTDRKGDVEAYQEAARRATEIDRTSLEREKSGVFLGTHAVNPVNGAHIPIWISDYVLLSYGTGAIMCVPAHDERDFEFATQFDLPIVEVIANQESQKDAEGCLTAAWVGEGAMIQSGPFSGLPSEQGKKKIVEWLAEKGLGKPTVAYRLRDWVFSRQRYWGEPIPVVHCPKCGEVPVPEQSLPVLLPEVEQYEPTGTGQSPLAAIPEFVNTACPSCGQPAKRETDTMPQWAGSSWYFLRYPNPKLADAAFSRERASRWLPVDLYVGGVEHAILHLLYARFFTKVLYDIDAVDFDEPFARLFNQGMVCRQSDTTGKLEKMSKSKGNIVSPDELVERYGADTVRLYELFIGPPEQDSEWSDQGIEGVHRFLKRVWHLVLKNKDTAAIAPDEMIHQRHLLIKNVTAGLEEFGFNTTVSRFMEFVNYAYSPEGGRQVLDRESVEALLILLAPFAPHIAEELWERTGHETSVLEASWPTYDEAVVQEDMVTLVVQVNGKVRARVGVPADIGDEAAKALALEQKNVQAHMGGRPARKVVVVPRKLVSIVV